MNPKYTHDFSSASIKHIIEAEFYQKAGIALGNSSATVTIVTGPDYQRHLNNVDKYINSSRTRICEIDTDIFIPIYTGCKDNNKVSVVNKSIELYGSRFIDCDLTCTSDLGAIRNTLLKQIDVQATSAGIQKAFIFSIGLRGGEGMKYTEIFNSIIGLLGAIIQTSKPTSVKQVVKFNLKANTSGLYQNEIRFQMLKGRIKEYKCYSYNAGGGPMLTCLIIYK